jgi:hypothetical protein
VMTFRMVLKGILGRERGCVGCFESGWDLGVVVLFGMGLGDLQQARCVTISPVP